MKKRVALALFCFFTCTLFLTGCTGDDTGISLGSTWNETGSKTYVYTLSHTAGTSTCGYDFTLTEGTYTTTVTVDTTTASKTILYETTLSVTGKYTKGEEEIPFTDTTTTTTKMHGINTYCLFPIESERIIDQHSVYPENNQGFSIRHHEYKINSTYNYNNKNAEVSFHAKNSETGEFDLPVAGIPENRTYTKLSAGTFFDNDALTFIFRAFPLAPSFSTSYTTIDTVNAKKVSMYVSAESEVTTRSYHIDGVETQLDVIKLTARMDAGASSGQPFTLYYAVLEGQAENNVLTEFSSALPYGMGTLTYKLTSSL